MVAGGGIITGSAVFGFVAPGGAIALSWVVGGVIDQENRVAGDRNLVRGGEAMPKQSPAEYEIAPHRKAK